VMGQAECRQPKPTDSRIMAPKLRILYPGTRSGKSRSGRGEAEGDGVIRERCKGTEQPERLQCKIALISAAEEPHGRLKSAEGFLSQRFPPSCRGLRSFTSLCSHTHRKWGNIGIRDTVADRDRRGGGAGGLTGLYGFNINFTSTGTEFHAKGLDFRLGEPSCMPSDREDHLQRELRRTSSPGVHGDLD